MRPPILLALLLTAATFAEGELGPARRVSPPHVGDIPFDSFVAGAPDGRTFIIRMGTTPTAAVPGTGQADINRVVLLDSDGTQVNDATYVPDGFWLVGMAHGQYVFVNHRSYVRMSADGVLLDAAPRALPFESYGASVAGANRILLIGARVALFDPLTGVSSDADRPNGEIMNLAAKGDRFAISYRRDGVFYARFLDETGTVLRDESIPGVHHVQTDGSTWLLVPISDATPHRIVDDDLRTLRTFVAPHSWAVPGRGYTTRRHYGDIFGVDFVDVRGPEYFAQTTRVEKAASGYFQLWGSASAWLYFDHLGGTPGAAHLLKSLDDLRRPLPPALTFTGALDVERPVAASNAAGVSLLVWNEARGRLRASLYAARVSANGALLDANPVPLTEECRDLRAAVATDGTDFFVGWSGCAQAGGHLVAANGTVTPSFALPNGKATLNQATAAFDGESYVFAWLDGVSTRLTRVLRDGSPVLPPPAKINGTGPRLAPLPGGGSLLVYYDPVNFRLVSQRLTRELKLDGSASGIVTAPSQAYSVTRAGNRFLLAARIDAPGTPAGPFLMWLDAQGKPSSTQPVGVPIASEDPRVFCEAECVLVTKAEEYPWSPVPARLFRSAIGTTATGGVSVGPAEVLHDYERGFRTGEVVLLRGTADPQLLLYSAPDRGSSSLQVFARSTAAKRRASRP